MLIPAGTPAGIRAAPARRWTWRLRIRAAQPSRVFSFCLSIVITQTVVRRLQARSLGLEPRAQPWEIEVLDGWQEQLRRPEFAQQVVRAWLPRYAATVRSIRWS